MGYWDSHTFPAAFRTEDKGLIAYDYEKAKVGIIIPNRSFVHVVMENVPFSVFRAALFSEKILSILIQKAELVIPFNWGKEAATRQDILVLVKTKQTNNQPQ